MLRVDFRITDDIKEKFADIHEHFKANPPPRGNIKEENIGYKRFGVPESFLANSVDKIRDSNAYRAYLHTIDKYKNLDINNESHQEELMRQYYTHAIEYYGSDVLQELNDACKAQVIATKIQNEEFIRQMTLADLKAIDTLTNTIWAGASIFKDFLHPNQGKMDKKLLKDSKITDFAAWTYLSEIGAEAYTEDAYDYLDLAIMKAMYTKLTALETPKKEEITPSASSEISMPPPEVVIPGEPTYTNRLAAGYAIDTIKKMRYFKDNNTASHKLNSLEVILKKVKYDAHLLTSDEKATFLATYNSLTNEAKALLDQVTLYIPGLAALLQHDVEIEGVTLANVAEYIDGKLHQQTVSLSTDLLNILRNDKALNNKIDQILRWQNAQDKMHTDEMTDANVYKTAQFISAIGELTGKERIIRAGRAAASTYTLFKEANNLITATSAIRTAASMGKLSFAALTSFAGALSGVGLAAIAIFSGLGSNNTANSKMLRQIMEQLTTLRREMHQRFDQIDESLWQMTMFLETLINKKLTTLNADLEKGFDELKSLSKEILLTDVKKIILASQSNNQIPESTLQEYLHTLEYFMEETAFLNYFTGRVDRAWDVELEENKEKLLTVKQPLSQIGYLADALHNTLDRSFPKGETLPNPILYINACMAYLTLLNKHALFTREYQLEETKLTAISETLTKIDRALGLLPDMYKALLGALAEKSKELVTYRQTKFQRAKADMGLNYSEYGLRNYKDINHISASAHFPKITIAKRYKWSEAMPPTDWQIRNHEFLSKLEVIPVGLARDLTPLFTNIPMDPLFLIGEQLKLGEIRFFVLRNSWQDADNTFFLLGGGFYGVDGTYQPIYTQPGVSSGIKNLDTGPHTTIRAAKATFLEPKILEVMENKLISLRNEWANDREFTMLATRLQQYGILAKLLARIFGIQNPENINNMLNHLRVYKDLTATKTEHTGEGSFVATVNSFEEIQRLAGAALRNAPTSAFESLRKVVLDSKSLLSYLREKFAIKAEIDAGLHYTEAPLHRQFITQNNGAPWDSNPWSINLFNSKAISSFTFRNANVDIIPEKPSAVFSYPFDAFKVDDVVNMDKTTGIKIFTLRYFKEGREVGTIDFFGENYLCFSPDQTQHNIVSTTGIFATWAFTPEMGYSQCRVLPPPTLADRVSSSMQSGATQGFLRGGTKVMKNVLEAQGFTKPIANFLSQVSYYGSVFTWKLSSHIGQMQVESSPEDYFNAMYAAAAETGQLWVMTQAVNKASEFLKSYGWNKLASVTSWSVFAHNTYRTGLAETVTALASGVATEMLTENVGQKAMKYCH